jgi:Na+-driven multidrug efflux pump
VLLASLPTILDLLGASADTSRVAQRFLWITLPSNLFLALGMGLSGVLRAVGDAKRAMYVTLSGAIVTMALDPLLIFGFGLGTDGAAIATVVSRCLFALVGLHGAVRVHDLVAWPRLNHLVADFRPMFAIAIPAVLTNVATPVAGAFFAGVLAHFGDGAIAGIAIIDRIVPVAFGGLFALSGAIGPILGQNWGARRFGRMRQALRDGILFLAVYVTLVWMLLLALRWPLARLFNATGLAAEVVTFFCLISGPSWFFIGLLFLANASFNNLGFPLLSTFFNWGRATLGTIPFALLGARFGGPEGALAGVGAGAFLFGSAAIWTAFRTIQRLERRAT